MENLQTFENKRFGQLRTYRDEHGNPWFCAQDIAEALGYSEGSKPSRLFNAVPEEWKGVKPFHTLGGVQDILTLSEHGLYFFLGRSDKPKALPYQKWVAGEVVPAIRKTGEYKVSGSGPSKSPDQNTAEELVNARLQVVTLRIMGSMSIYTPALRMRFLAEAASLMSGKPMSEYLPPMEAGDISGQWLPASGLAKRYGLSNSEIGRLLKKRGLHGSQDENHEWSLPICYPDQDGLCKLVGYLYNLEILEPRLRRTMEEHHANPCH